MEGTFSDCRAIFLGKRHAPLTSRISARLVDSLLMLALFFIGRALWSPLGLLLAAGYGILQDSMGIGQSFGKRMMGIRVIEEDTGLSCSTWACVVRNLPFILGLVCAASPLAWPLFILVALPILGLETYLVFSLETGIRLGDVLAGTLVKEYVEGESSRVTTSDMMTAVGNK